MLALYIPYFLTENISLHILIYKPAILNIQYFCDLGFKKTHSYFSVFLTYREHTYVCTIMYTTGTPTFVFEYSENKHTEEVLKNKNIVFMIVKKLQFCECSQIVRTKSELSIFEKYEQAKNLRMTSLVLICKNN